jgi:hypothetical protein
VRIGDNGDPWTPGDVRRLVRDLADRIEVGIPEPVFESYGPPAT